MPSAGAKFEVIMENGEKKNEGAKVEVNLVVEDVLGRSLETEEERQVFLAIISSFFSSEPVYNQLKQFVKLNM